ncbi:major facilitator superfamily domain-containing protein [Coniochaeta sp. 2T2.1]|nr:major facilitator superfamily domain-containing protein [Coniochaeta sp. 2T2.1]
MIITLIRKARKNRAAGTTKSPADPPCQHQLETPTNQNGANQITDGSTTQAAQPSKCPTCRDEKRQARTYRWKLILGLIFPFALQALDVTVVASALPWVAVDFNSVPELNWIISAFNLTSAAFIPFWGQMADIFGRHYVLQACVVVMMVGSALCTGAPTGAFPVLLLGRGIQGLGCAGISVVVRIVLADKVSLEENAKNWSIFTVTAGVSYGVGPVIGGYLTKTNWRWCFAINLPVCAAAILLIFILLRKELLGPQPIPIVDGTTESSRRARFTKRLMTIDVGGQLLFLFGFGLLVLALTWAGATYAWDSAYVLAPLIIGCVLIGVFAFYEKLMRPGEGFLSRRWPIQQAMVPWKLIANRDVGLMFYITVCTGAAMYSVLYFVSLYFTMVKQYDAGDAGVQLLYYTPGIGLGAYLSMFMCNVYPKNTFSPVLFGSVVEAVGVGVLAWALYSEHTPSIFGMMALTGAGTGLRFMPTSLHVIGFFPKNIATIISLMAVALPFGGTLALTIMATVFNNTSGIGPDSPFRDFTTLSGVPEPMKSQIIHQAKMGVVWAFVAITPFMVLCILAAMFLGNVNVTKEKNAEGNVYHGVYLLHLLRRRRSPRVDAEDVQESGAKKV